MSKQKKQMERFEVGEKGTAAIEPLATTTMLNL